MAINPVASGSSAQVIRPQPQAAQTSPAELAKEAEKVRQAKKDEQANAAEATKAKPFVNTQGQTTGNAVNTLA